MSFTIRPFVDADYEAIARIVSEVDQEVVTAQSLRDEDRARPERYKHGAWIAEVAGEAVGFTHYQQLPAFYHPQKFDVSVAVLPRFRRQGIGSALWHQLEEGLTPFDPISLSGGTKEDRPEAIRFAEARGFVEKLRNWESHLDIQQFDLEAWQPVVAEAEAKGYAMKSLAELYADPDWQQKLYALVMEVRRDVPTSEPWQETPYDEWLKMFEANTHRYPEAYFIGIHGDEWIGLSALWHSDEEGVVTTGLTAIKRAHRGSGITRALKVKAIGVARADGYKKTKTWNESNNVRMLAINQKMGFVRQPAWISFQKQIKSES